MPKSPIILALIAAVLFGAATPASKLLLDILGTYQLAGLLYLGASLGVLPFIFRQKVFSWPWKIDKKSSLLLLGSVVSGGLLGPILFLFGLKFASAASVSLWLNLELVATALLGIILFRDHLTALGWYSFGIMLAAAILLSTGEEKAGFQGGMLVTAACFCWGLDNHFTALITGISPSQTTFWKGVVAGTVNLLIGMATGDFMLSISKGAMAIGIGAFSYGLSVMFYISAAQRIGATRSQIIFSASPFFGVLFSALFLAEIISKLQILSTFMILSALVILFFDHHSHIHCHGTKIHKHWHYHDDKHHDHGNDVPSHGIFHTHHHRHQKTTHSHPHWPDQNHRHDH
ncbi:MAG: DMT family transporter [Desulfobacterales bacterium]|jgi:drug/metabolite transporter (DMT)-like permease|nr:DMT family transporter [Desulfobacterales bacterium]